MDAKTEQKKKSAGKDKNIGELTEEISDWANGEKNSTPSPNDVKFAESVGMAI